MDSTRRVWELTERDALLGAWCPACEQPFSAGQRVFIAFGQPTCHEDCELVSRPLASDRKPDDASRVFRHAGISYLHIPALDLRRSAAFYEAVSAGALVATPSIRVSRTAPAMSSATGSPMWRLRAKRE